MSDCQFCGIVHGKSEAKKLYEDEQVLVILAEKPCALGHAQVILKKHAGSLDGLPKDVLASLFWTASFTASSIFEYLGPQGTNIIYHDALKGHEHPVLDIIPRKFEDGLDFQWQPKELSEQENTTAFEKLKDAAFFIGKEKPEAKEREPVQMDEKRKEITGSENYQIRRLVRIP